MKQLRLLLGFFLLLFNSSLVFSNEDLNTINISSTSHRLNISLDAEYTQLSSSSTSISGYGLRLSTKYALRPEVAVVMGVGQAFEGVGAYALYTTLSFHFAYPLKGKFFYPDRELRFNDHKYMEVKIRPRPLLYISAGLEQYFFNGSSAVFSGSGPGTALMYDFPFRDISLRGGVRVSYLTLTDSSVTVLGGIFGVNWSF